MKDEENKMQSAAPEQQAQPEQTQPESEPAADAAQPGTENEPKAETTAPETPDKKKRPLWLKLLAVFAAALAVLVLLAVLYINGKLDLIHYDDGTVDSVGTVDAERTGRIIHRPDQATRRMRCRRAAPLRTKMC